MQKYSIDSTWSWTKPNAIQKICWSSNNSSIELESANDDQFKVDTISILLFPNCFSIRPQCSLSIHQRSQKESFRPGQNTIDNLTQSIQQELSWNQFHSIKVTRRCLWKIITLWKRCLNPSFCWGYHRSHNWPIDQETISILFFRMLRTFNALELFL